MVWQDLRKLLIVLKGLINVPQGELMKFVEIMEYQILNWPINYLGLPLGGKPQFIGSLRTRLALVQRKLAVRKRKYLFLERVITLNKATTTNLSIYFLSVSKMRRGW